MRLRQEVQEVPWNRGLIGPYRALCLFRLVVEFYLPQFEEAPMLASKLVRLIEAHSDRLADDLLAKVQNSERCSDLRNVPADELRDRTHEIYRNLSDWLLSKTEQDIATRYMEI